MGNPIYLVSDSARTIAPLGAGDLSRAIRPYPGDLEDPQWVRVIFKMLVSSPTGVRVVDVDEMSELARGGYLQVVRDAEFAAFASDPDPGEQFQSFTSYLARS